MGVMKMCMHDYSDAVVEIYKKEAREEANYLKSIKKFQNEARKVILSLTDDISLNTDFNIWLKTQFQRYMFYVNENNKKTGYCETCGAVTFLKKARSGERYICPNCGCEVKLRLSKFSPLEERKIFSVLNKTEKGIIQRLFVVFKKSWFSNEEKKVLTKFKINEEQRDILFFEYNDVINFHPVYKNIYDTSLKIVYPKLTGYKVGPGRLHGMFWTAWRVEDCEMSLYPNNLSSVLSDTLFKYSALDLANLRSKVNPLYYLQQYKLYPNLLEMLYKKGLVRVAEQLLEYNRHYGEATFSNKIRDAKTLKDLYINNKAELEDAVKHNYGYEELRALSFVRNWKLDEKEIGQAIAFMKIVINHSGEDFEYSFISNKSLYNYAKRQTTKKIDQNYFRSFFADYTDYISECLVLGYNLNDTAISRPSDFKKMHDNIMAIKKFNQSHVFDIGVSSAWKNLHKYVDYSDGNLSVIMAKTTDEIIQEGSDNSHCVGRYCERVAKGESIICFIRKNNDLNKSYYTMELKPDMKHYDLVQCRGYNNCDANEEVYNFLEKYKSWFNKRSVENFDESKLTSIYYKAVKKNKKGEYVSIHDSKTKYQIGVLTEIEADNNPDNVYVKGMHLASLEFAKSFGNSYDDAVILEVEVNIHDVIIPDAKDQVRCSKYKIIREVPYEELGAWGERRLKNRKLLY